MIRVYYEYHDRWTSQEALQELYNRISPARRALIGETASDRRKLEVLVSGFLLEEGLRMAGVKEPYTFGVSDRGKPYLLHPEGEKRKEIGISLSHTKEMSAAAIGITSDQDLTEGQTKEREWEIGVDVEAIGRYRERVVERFFTGEETAYFQMLRQEIEQSSRPSVRQQLEQQRQILFAKLWTGKEAIAKCFDVPLVEVCRTYNLLEPVDLQLAYHHTEGHVICCASAMAQEIAFIPWRDEA